LKTQLAAHSIPPSAAIQPVLDGEVTSYFEWMGAGEYAVDSRQGAMHGAKSGLRMLYYGAGNGQLFLRLDFDPNPEWANLELRVTTLDTEVRLGPSGISAGRVVEAAIPLAAGFTGVLVFQVSVWFDGIPVELLPADGWLNVEIPASNWSV